MIDTIKIQQRYTEQERAILEAFFSETLIPETDVKYLKGYKGRSIRSTFGNWTFYLGVTNFKITGSLTTASKKNNLYNSEFEDIKKALDELQELFCLDLSNTNITRLDLAYNFVMKHPVFNYYNFLLCPDKFKPINYANETLQFDSEKVTFKFYDKIKERAKNKKLPKAYKKMNILRYEISLNRKGMKKTCHKHLKLSDLRDKHTYLGLVNAWFDQYLHIPKRKSYNLPTIDHAGVKAYKDFAVKYLLNSPEGVDFTRSFLADKNTSAKARHDIKDYIEQLNFGEAISNPIEDELLNKVKGAYCRA